MSSILPVLAVVVLAAWLTYRPVLLALAELGRRLVGLARTSLAVVLAAAVVRHPDTATTVLGGTAVAVVVALVSLLVFYVAVSSRPVSPTRGGF